VVKGRFQTLDALASSSEMGQRRKWPVVQALDILLVILEVFL